MSRVRLAYHGADDPDRFGIVHEDLPGAHLHPPHPSVGPVDAPVVVSPNLLFGLLPRLRDTYEPLRGRTPDARAGVFLVYDTAADFHPQPVPPPAVESPTTGTTGR